jgi:hypothetical protein
MLTILLPTAMGAIPAKINQFTRDCLFDQSNNSIMPLSSLGLTSQSNSVLFE